MKIASKLQQGVKVERTLDDIRDSICEDVKHEHLLTRQDITTIIQAYTVKNSSVCFTPNCLHTISVQAIWCVHHTFDGVSTTVADWCGVHTS